ncbi:hypothetical protein [Neobacillus dielmonensis]|uniref:hypothetical protein n=1 Tax=Neobacillus dielmonensis TaxID=1347369 RepID=UPI0005A957CD|nr:hypothetical protein [Neobacillus dielmonensis]
MFFSLILILSLILFILSISFALKGKKRYYYLAAIAIYIFSLIASWSIGQITVGLTSIFLALAIGYSLNLIKTRLQITICSGIGMLIGLFVVFFIDDAYLFFPLQLLS